MLNVKRLKDMVSIARFLVIPALAEKARKYVFDKGVKSCPKCHQTDLSTMYAAPGEAVDTGFRNTSDTRLCDAFGDRLYVEHGRYLAKDELLKFHCRTCQYGWLEDLPGAKK